MAIISRCDCGGEAEFIKVGKNIGYVECQKCRKASKIYTSKQNAIKAWNGEWSLSRFLLCPVCGGKTEVTDSRSDCESVRRKRKCMDCGYKFNTVEIDEDLYKKISKESL